eukprot:1140840-Pelagomonas_calceolata.AAC.13
MLHFDAILVADRAHHATERLLNKAARVWALRQRNQMRDAIQAHHATMHLLSNPAQIQAVQPSIHPTQHLAQVNQRSPESGCTTLHPPPKQYSPDPG